jgi:tetratricopeptide (TPR) repeat protein
MKLKAILFSLSLMFNFYIWAQVSPKEELDLAIEILSRDNIADVNIDQTKYISYISNVTVELKKAFSETSTNQKVGVLMISHKTGATTFEVYSEPEIEIESKTKLLNSLSELKVENTKICDFPILFTINLKGTRFKEVFKTVSLPDDKARTEFERADLKTKSDLLKKWSVEEALPVISAYQVKVDDKFAGVKNLGKLLNELDFNHEHSVQNSLNNNTNYWRAVLEMEHGNQLVPLAKIAFLVSQSQFDYAGTYLDIVNMFAADKTIALSYLQELNWRLVAFNKQLTNEINKGIALHDQAKYQEAIEIYSSILKSYPNSAWANYELYYSQNALEVQQGKVSKDDRTLWNKAKPIIFKCNPMYGMDVRASNGKEGYLLFRRQSISDLFKDGDQKLKDVYKYADIAMDLEVYDFAAQLFWLSASFDKNAENALYKFLYCLEKLEVTDIKNNFKGNFEKEFKKIETKKEKEMKASPIYKSFKN